MKIIRTNTPTQIKAKQYVSEIRKYFDTPNLQDIIYRSHDYKDFLMLKMTSPTVADIAFQEELSKKSLKYPKEFNANLEYINEDSIVKYILSVVAKRQAIDFEKTGRLRKNLIKNDRFSLDYVKPKLESKWQKFILKFKSVI